MKKNKKETDIEVKSIKYRILTIAFLIVICALMISAAKTENEILLISSSCIIGVLILLNLRYVIVNSKMVSSVKVLKKDIVSTNLHPLELYILDCVWYHKKKRFSKEQIYASVLYEIENGVLIQTEKGIKISNKIDLKEMSIYSLKALEMSLLEKIDCRKIDRLKMAKLKTLQDDEISIVIDDLNSNIVDNCMDKENFYTLLNIMKEEHFVEIESSMTVYLTIASWACAVLTIPFVFAFFDKATFLNLYLPIGLVVVLIATITSNYRERVMIKEDSKNYLFDNLNYIHYLNVPRDNKKDIIYSYCLGKNDGSSINKLFIK